MQAQPANNNCTAAQVLTNLNNGCVSGTTTGATFDAYAFTCMSGSNNVWYRFTAQGPELTITVSGANGSRPEIGLSRANGNGCSSAVATGLRCASSNGNWSTMTTTLNSLVIGEEYYIQVTNGGNTTGAFTICVDNPPPPPPSGTQDCDKATPICSTTPFSGNSNGFGNQELNASNRGCLGSNENNSSWFYFTAQTSGTLTFSIAPQANDDYDFAVWGPNSDCSPTTPPIRCSYALFPRSGSGANACGTNNRNTGLALNAAQTTQDPCSDGFVRHLDIVAGETYILLIDGFSPRPDPYTISFGGTASLDCTILSVQLLNFEGQEQAGFHQLNWATAQEAGSKSFYLERSFDGRTWETLQEQTAQGHSQSLQTYQAQVPILALQTYYRLRIENQQGQFDYSQVLLLRTGQSSETSLALRRVFPQPSQAKQFNLEWSAARNARVEIQILSLQGQVLHRQVVQSLGLQHQQSLELQNLSAGVYYLQLRDLETGQHQAQTLYLD